MEISNLDTQDQPDLSLFIKPEQVSYSEQYAGYQVIRRNGKLTSFDRNKIMQAMTKAFLAVEGGQAATSRKIHESVHQLADLVIGALVRRLPDGGVINIEDIQDQVELGLMRQGYHKVARAYVLYREQRKREREAEKKHSPDTRENKNVRVVREDGSDYKLEHAQIIRILEKACKGRAQADPQLLIKETLNSLYDGIAEKDLGMAMVISTRLFIERDPDYSYIAANLLLQVIIGEAERALYNRADNIIYATEQKQGSKTYAEYFSDYITYAVKQKLLDPQLLQFDLSRLGSALKYERDYQFGYLGLQTLYDRYFLNDNEQRLELPQAFFMRVAMGLALNEIDREASAIAFYQLLSSFDFMSSTPTLFNSGTLRPQLSSCYLTTVPDNLDGIFAAIKDNALLSKFAGGLGNDWTSVRGLGAVIQGTHGKSQGVVPFLKVVNDTAVAVNQGGKRKGAICAYLETWHIDIEEFLDLRKNTGDDRRRTHDMNTANWIPDLFMQRVAEEGDWTLFSPDETPDLHDLYGQAFRERYEEYEARADQGKIKRWKRLPANQLWRKMLGQLFETGHPWITFKDPCNIRYSNQHAGVVHSSNLCTEITLHTNEQEIAVCNLGSVNLAAHVSEQGLDTEKLEKTITLAMRMLDNVIDYNYYAVPQARHSNLKHRPVGLGLMGFQDALYKLNIAYGSEQAVEFADRSMETIAYFAIKASSDLAKQRGRYSSFNGSLWSQGILPLDSIELLKKARGEHVVVDSSSTLDWDSLRDQVKQTGMRNSNCIAIAPTATIANICGISQSIEPTYQNFYVKSNLSGEFTIVNTYLVEDLKVLGLWDEVMISDLKYFDGSLQKIDRIPDNIKLKYATAFEIDSRWLIEAASRRQKWIDQGQSLNLYLAKPDGRHLDNLYKLAWVRGLKTTYYLRTLAATHVEKTVSCSIDDPDCDACQ